MAQRTRMDCKVTPFKGGRTVTFPGYVLTDNGRQCRYFEDRPKKKRSVPMGSFADCVTEMAQRSGLPASEILAAIKKAEKAEKKAK